MTHHLSVCPRSWSLPGACICGSAKRSEAEGRPTGNAVRHQAARECLCFGCYRLIDGAHDEFCSAQCEADHDNGVCACFDEIENEWEDA